MLKRNILIVEDEIIIAREIEKKLIALGYNVPDIAVSGIEAMKKIEEYRPDLILMDIRIKGKQDGIETAAEITRLFDIPIVFLTAYSDENTVERARVVESYGYILKPIQDNTFQIVIDHAFYKFQAKKIIRENELWLSEILNSISEGVIAIDTEGLVKFINPVAEKLTGWDQKEASHKELKEVFRKQEGPISEDNVKQNDFQHILSEKNMGRNEKKVVLIRKKGDKSTVFYRIDPIMDSNSNVIGEVLIMRPELA